MFQCSTKRVKFFSIFFYFYTRYLASGCSFTELNHEYRLGISTISGFVAQVCELIQTNLKEICMPQPSKENWLKVSNGFEKNANFPNCLGAVAHTPKNLPPVDHCITITNIIFLLYCLPSMMLTTYLFL